MTLLGYAGEICYDIVAGEAYLFASSIIVLFISLCQHHQAFYKMFQLLLDKLNYSDDKRKQNAKDGLFQLIRFHTLAKE